MRMSDLGERVRQALGRANLSAVAEWTAARREQVAAVSAAGRARSLALSKAREALDSVTRLLVEAFDPEQRASLLLSPGREAGALALPQAGR